MNALLSKIIIGTGSVAAFALATLPLAASAGEISDRVANQQARIDRAVANGQITRHDYFLVENRLHRINAQRDFDLRMNGGRLTPGERFQLNRELDNNSNLISFTAHD